MKLTRLALLPLSALIIVACLFFTSTSIAHLGETQDEIEARFGSPSDGSTKFYGSLVSSGSCTAKIYDCNGFRIEVLFLGGKSISEAYIAQHSRDEPPVNLDTLLTTILQATGEGQDWKHDRQADAHRYFRNDDNVMVLRCHDHYIVVSDVDGYQRAKSQ